MKTHCDTIAESLYQLFSTTILFAKDVRPFDQLCGLGYAEKVSQGHAEGYRITPDGYRVATDRWGHGQRCSST